MALAPGDKLFQQTFGRTPQTKALDHVLANRDSGINLTELSKKVRVSYVYMVNIINDLEDKKLVIRETHGRESIVRPNMRNGVVRSLTSAS
jgi:DNA-binding MarR family transcriptional regulator